MPRAHFDQQLHGIQREVLALGEDAAAAVERAVAALRERAAGPAQAVIAGDGALDDRAYALEEQALLLIATQQPMAGDVRLLAAVIAIAGELERIGDYAEGIAKIVLLSLAESLLQPPLDLPRMAERAVDMLRRSLTAFLARDAAAARAIWHEDDAIDALHEQVYRELLTSMMADPHTIARATHLLWVVHNLERIADRVTNICERTSFLVTGDRADLRMRG